MCYHESYVVIIYRKVNYFLWLCRGSGEYCNPGHDDALYGCLLNSIIQVQCIDNMAVSVVICDANGWSLPGARLSDVMLSTFETILDVNGWFEVTLMLLVTDLTL